MATSSTNAAALGDITRFAEMRKRLWFLLGALVVYRVGTFIPVPGIDAARFAAFFSGQQGTLLGTIMAEKAKAAGVTTAVFDRGSYRFHGRVKAVAEAARAAGLTI